MKKILLLFIVASVSFSRGEISFTKQKEKVEQERLLKIAANNTSDTSEEIEEKIDTPTTLFEDDSEKKTKIYKVNKNVENRKLIEYIKTQNKKITEQEIKTILGYVFKYSKEYNFNPHLVLAVMNTESHFRHSTVSSAGAKGLMQLMPFNFKEFGVDNSIEGNIKGGIMHLKRDYEKTGSVAKTLVCYNAGCSRLKNDTWKNIKETREYIPKVLEKYKVIKNL